MYFKMKDFVKWVVKNIKLTLPWAIYMYLTYLYAECGHSFKKTFKNNHMSIPIEFTCFQIFHWTFCELERAKEFFVWMCGCLKEIKCVLCVKYIFFPPTFGNLFLKCVASILDSAILKFTGTQTPPDSGPGKHFAWKPKSNEFKTISILSFKVCVGKNCI